MGTALVTAEEYSLPYPTTIQRLADTPGARIVRSQPLGIVSSRDARATAAAISVATATGEQQAGIEIQLTSPGSSEQVLLDDKQIAVVLSDLESVSEEGYCAARERCFMGVARCRPSQQRPQALCVARYWHSETGSGMTVSTPEGVFDFPGVRPETLASMLSMAR